MMNYKIKTLFLGLITLLFSSYNTTAQQTYHDVQIVGSMKDVMWNGKLIGNISLDTISNKQHLYGLGLVEYLTGELMVIDGKSYKSTILADTTLRVEETCNSKAAFFGYANIDKWDEQIIPDSIRKIQQLEIYINKITKSSKRPFMFKLTGSIETAIIHIANLPEGSTINSPKEAHKRQVKFPLTNEQVIIVGFFSTEHKGIFTHQDTYLHLHLITADTKKMGHLDALLLKKGTGKLYLPLE